MLVFEPELLADTALHMGGYIDRNGNVYRANDVLNDDYDDPILLGGQIYPVANVEKVVCEIGGVRMVDYYITLEAGNKIALNSDEYGKAVHTKW